MLNQAFLIDHQLWSRRYFLRAGVSLASIASLGLASPLRSRAEDPAQPEGDPSKKGVFYSPYFTPQDDFGDVSRGDPLPHKLPDDKKVAVGLTRETWKLEVVADKDNPPRLGKQLTKADGTALDFAALLKLGETHAVRFPKVMTCLNLGCPLGMGIWEGVPMREILALAQPRQNFRRVFYYGYHNDKPEQMFKSSLPVGRILEDLYNLPPVILCYKLNGEWLNSERGGPVRVVVPEAYGFKSIKWLSHLVLTNLAHANDTYAEQNNDVESPLKTYAATLSFPKEIKAGEKIPISGYAQVGVGGLTKVQVSIEPSDKQRPEADLYFTTAPWVDAELRKPPTKWGAIENENVPANTLGFDKEGKPNSWPMKLTKAHWAAVLPGLPPGAYTLRARSIDENGKPQPHPRPQRQSGHAAIESIDLEIK